LYLISETSGEPQSFDQVMMLFHVFIPMRIWNISLCISLR